MSINTKKSFDDLETQAIKSEMDYQKKRFDFTAQQLRAFEAEMISRYKDVLNQDQIGQLIQDFSVHKQISMRLGVAERRYMHASGEFTARTTTGWGSADNTQES